MHRVPGSPVAGGTATATLPEVKPKLCSCRSWLDLLPSVRHGSSPRQSNYQAHQPRWFSLLTLWAEGIAKLFMKRSKRLVGHCDSHCAPLNSVVPGASAAQPHKFRHGNALGRPHRGRLAAGDYLPAAAPQAAPLGDTAPSLLASRWQIAGLGAGLSLSPLARATCRSAPRRQRRLCAAHRDSFPDRRPPSPSPVRHSPHPAAARGVCPAQHAATRPHPGGGRTWQPAALASPRPVAPQRPHEWRGARSPYPVGGEDLPVALFLRRQGRELLHGVHAVAAAEPLHSGCPTPSTSLSDEPRWPGSCTYTLAGRGGSAFCLLGRLSLPPPPPNNNKPPQESRHIPTPFAHQALPLGDKLRDGPLANFSLKPSPREGG